jgi:hypothetical protein
MRDAEWDFGRSDPSPNEICVRLGLRGNWRQAVAGYSEAVEEILNELEVPHGAVGAGEDAAAPEPAQTVSEKP